MLKIIRQKLAYVLDTGTGLRKAGGGTNGLLPGLFRSISSDYETATNEKQDKSCDLSCLVDQTPKFSNLLEDLWKVERFAQYIENQASENMAEMEGSEIKQ